MKASRCVRKSRDVKAWAGAASARWPVPGPRSAQAAKYEEWRVCETVRRAAASAASVGWREVFKPGFTLYIISSSEILIVVPRQGCACVWRGEVFS